MTATVSHTSVAKLCDLIIVQCALGNALGFHGDTNNVAQRRSYCSLLFDMFIWNK